MRTPRVDEAVKDAAVHRGPIDRERIAATYRSIRSHLRRTPVIDVAGADLGLDAEITLKLELLQHSGSFKARGAFASLLTRNVPPAGVVAASGGNHGAAAPPIRTPNHGAAAPPIRTPNHGRVLRIRRLGRLRQRQQAAVLDP